MPATKKSKVDLAQELGIVRIRTRSHPAMCKSCTESQITRIAHKPFKDWRDLVEAQIAKEYCPDDLVQEVFDEINDNRS